MKIQSIELKYFKKFGQPPVFDFTDAETGLAKDPIVLIGMNGAGKTNIISSRNYFIITTQSDYV